MTKDPDQLPDDEKKAITTGLPTAYPYAEDFDGIQDDPDFEPTTPVRPEAQEAVDVEQANEKTIEPGDVE